jgi:hypothetical protein
MTMIQHRRRCPWTSHVTVPAVSAPSLGLILLDSKHLSDLVKCWFTALHEWFHFLTADPNWNTIPPTTPAEQTTE